jgi:hypothetical protein
MGAPANAYQAQGIAHAFSLALRQEQLRHGRYTCFVRLRPDGMMNVELPEQACVADVAVLHGHRVAGGASVLTDFL